MYFLPQAWDLALFQVLNGDLRAPVLDVLMPVFSIGALLWVLCALVLVLVFRYAEGMRAAGLALLLILAVGATDQSVYRLKEQVLRVRPLNAMEDVHYREDGQWRQRPSGYVQTKRQGNSYPSGHAANSMAAALILALCLPRLRPWIWLLPLIVGWSRIYLGKHYPTDVMAGWAMGLAVAGLLYGWAYAFLPSRLRIWEP